MRKLAIIFLAATFSVPAAAQSSRAANDAEKNALFKKLDRNGDGYLSAEELSVPAAREGNWIAVDRNGDGRISLDEFGIVRDFARSEPAAAAGATRPPQDETPKASGQP
jgi:Ca2+-binding EF-hand superfamily protein